MTPCPHARAHNVDGLLVFCSSFCRCGAKSSPLLLAWVADSCQRSHLWDDARPPKQRSVRWPPLLWGQIAGISQHALQKSGRLADQWCVDDGDIMCHPILVLLFLQDVDVANDRVGAERNPRKRKSFTTVNDLDAAPPEWKIGDVPSLAKHFCSYRSYRHTRSCCGVSAFHHGPASEQGRCHSRNARARPALPGSANRFRPPSRKSGRQPYQPHPAGSWPQNPERTTDGSGLR